MRAAIALVVVPLALLLAGCGDPAVSVRPLYLAGEKPVAEPKLEGQWLSSDQDSPRRWSVSADANGCYSVQAQKTSADRDKEDQSESYRTCLVRLEDKLFFDSELVSKNFGPRKIGANDLGPGVTTNHIIGRVWLEKDLLRLARLDSKWIRDNTPPDFREMRTEYSAVITASTAALRKVVAEQADNAAAWGPDVYLCRAAIDCQLRVTEDQLARAPNDADVLQGAAGFYITRGDYAKATALMRRAVGVKPNEASAHGYLALALSYQRDFEDARRELAAAQKLDADNRDLYAYFVGMSYFLEGKYQEAAREIAAFRAGQKEQQAGPILFQYFALLRSGRAKEAKALLNKETGRFTGSREGQLLLLQAAGRVTDPTWGQMSEDAKNDMVFLYAENSLALGDTKAARAALEFILKKPGDDPFVDLAARIELERMDNQVKAGTGK